MLAAYQKRNFAPQMAGLELRESSIEAVNIALDHATEKICAEGGITESDVDSLTSKAA